MADVEPTPQPTWHLQVVEETGSTNTDLMAAAADGAPNRSVLCTRHQTAGRGRGDRRWDAPPGTNLLVSMLLREGVEYPHRLTQRVAVAAAIACERVAGLRPDLKWPNDLLLDGAKLGGILAQAGGHAGRVEYVVVGLGLNVGWAPEGAARLGPSVDPEAVLGALLAAFDEIGESFDAEYRRRLLTLGQDVRVTVFDGEILGRAVNVLPDGRLVVVPEGSNEPVALDTGDVIHLRPVAD